MDKLKIPPKLSNLLSIPTFPWICLLKPKGSCTSSVCSCPLEWALKGKCVALPKLLKMIHLSFWSV